MANVRIKDITTTASAPNDDDYLAIDGATSGTRKILAKDLQTETDTTLTVAGKAADAKATGDEISALKEEAGDLSDLETADKTNLVAAINEAAQSGGSVASNTLPILYLVGDTSNMSKDVRSQLRYTWVDQAAGTQRTGWIDAKWQGETSTAYPKKNYNFRFYHDANYSRKDKINFFGLTKQSKWTAKANYIDSSHARNIVSARLWSDIVRSRHSNVPELLADSPNYGAIDGKPFVIYLNGSFHGLYTMNIKKDDFTFGMDEDNPLHCAVCGKYNNDGNQSISSTAVLSSEFRHASTGGWEVEVPSDFTTDSSAALINLITFVMTSTDADFYANLDTYLDVESAIDYYIFAYYICGADSLARNVILLTYDCVKWYCSFYDMDTTYGNGAHGGIHYAYNTEMPSGYIDTNSLLWIRLASLFGAEINERYQELRSTVLSTDYVIREFSTFLSGIPISDYNADIVKWPQQPNKALDHLNQISAFVQNRAVYVDDRIARLIPTTGIDSVTLSENTLSFVDSAVLVPNSSYFTYTELELSQYYYINSTGVPTRGTSAADYATVDYVSFDPRTDFVLNPYQQALRNSYISHDGTGVYNTYSDSTNITRALTDNNNQIGTTNTFVIQARSLENPVFHVSVKESAWNALDASLVPIGTNTNTYTGPVVQASNGAVVLMRYYSPNGTAYYTGFATYETAQSTSYITKLIDTNYKGVKFATVTDSSCTMIGFKVNRALYNEGGYIQYIVAPSVSSLYTASYSGWDDQTLTATISPIDATISNINWTSSDTSVVGIQSTSSSATYISTATLRAAGVGSATVTCTGVDTDGGTASATCSVSVSII